MESQNSSTQGAVQVLTWGGVGNQLFMYAAGYAFARSLQLPVVIVLPPEGVSGGPSSNASSRQFLLTFFNIPPSQFLEYKTSSDLRSKSRTVRINELNFHANLNGTVAQGKSNERKTFIFYDNFQSLTFFDNFRPELKVLFSLENHIKNTKGEYGNVIYFEELLENIQSTESIGVHVRRGDYVGSDDHTPLPMSYYLAAMKKMTTIKANARFFLFSDSIASVEGEFRKLNLTQKYPVRFVYGKYGMTTLQEFYLMGKCKNFIIPNSTYSWWVAYLHSSREKAVVIAPFPRFPESDFKKNPNRKNLERKLQLYPSKWILINPWSQSLNTTSIYSK